MTSLVLEDADCTVTLVGVRTQGTITTMGDVHFSVATAVRSGF